ncbi:MAG: Ldh family oxidoreductase [Hyphomicrobiales bacterium]|nr:Ldh family oxidoreductase [Hyphomicrobiales bacterium]MCP5374077.1 Ldh family oxidoreductase [Hyphomicrobiales bacterium]
MPDRYHAADLVAMATDLFARAGLQPPIAAAVADILVEADLLGYATHGLQFVPAYLAGIEAGRTTLAGEPRVVSDHGGAVVLDGDWLPGQWVMLRALDLALERVGAHPLAAVAVRRSQNISCLATYARRAALRGLFAMVLAAAPGNAVVAPHGGRAPRLSTNPMAVAFPGGDHPVLIDTSTSSVTNRLIERTRRAGDRLAQPWLVDADGNPTDDPGAIYTDPPGAILPAGGLELGHKGFALSLMVEALAGGLSGFGRADGDAAGNTVFLLLVDPAAFAGAEAFERQAAWVAAACRDTPPLAGGGAVRVPGDRAQAAVDEQTAQGIALHPEILPRLRPLLEKYGVAEPAPVRS